jgi:5'(3')-deoxyribonucleotidase
MGTLGILKIAVDADGVLYEWSKTARYMLRSYRDYDKDGPMGQESTSWDYIPQNILPQDWDWLWTEGVRKGLFRYGHLVTGAIEGVNQLSLLGEVVLVTHRPKAAVKDTLDWLSYINLPFSGIHILTNQEPKSMVDADILIDDKPDNIFEWVMHARHGVLFDREWNQKAQVGMRAKGWAEVVGCVEGIRERLEEGKGGRTRQVRNRAGTSDSGRVEETAGRK